jgi:D-glutamate cyclase
MKLLFRISLTVMITTFGNFMFGDVTNKDLVNRLEKVLHFDIGHRGISNFWTEGALLEAAETVNLRKNIVIITGFYVKSAKTAETDGPTGAIAIADAVRSLEKNVTIVTDKFEYNVIKTGVLSSAFPDTKVLALNSTDEIGSFIKNIKENTCVISIERLGRAADGKYYSMAEIDVSPFTAPLDDIILKSKHVKTIGIGDGGNEIGMGNKYKDIAKYVCHGKKIATVVKTDILITSGVSNWAGCALAIALQILNPDKDVVTPTAASDHKVLNGIVAVGSVDGVTSENKDSVDGFPFTTHAEVIRTMRLIMVQRIH